MDATAEEPLGAWVRPYEAGYWAQALASWCNDFPDAGAREDEWADFVHSSFRLPAILSAAGIFMSLFLPAVLCCCQLHPTKSKHAPSWWGFVGANILTLGSLAAGVYACLGVGGHGLAVAAGEMREAATDAWEANRYARALNASGAAVLRDLDLMYEACPRDAQDLLGNSVSSIERSVRSYIKVACHFSTVIQGLAPRLAVAREAGHSLGNFYAWCLALPSLLLVALCCATVATAVVVQEFGGPRLARRCERCQMPLVTLASIAPVMALLSAAASAELSLGVRLGAFCSNADALMLNYAAEEFGGASYGFNMTRYYVTGEGSNEALRALGLARADISSSINWMQKYRRIIEKTCPEWHPWSVTTNLQTVLVSLNATQQLLSPAQVYSHYHTVVHSFGCGGAISVLVCLVAQQALLIFVCLPTLAYATSRLQKGLVAERELWHRFDPLTMEEDDAIVGTQLEPF